MKKFAAGIVAVALLLSVTATGAFAAQAPAGSGRSFVDAHGDGVCDNYGAGTGRGFVDADGDGVCDNYGGTGRQGGRLGGRGGNKS